SAGVAPIVNWLAPGGDAVVACSVIVWFEPSGRLRLNWIVSPLFGFVARATEIDGGDPDGPVTVAPVSVALAPASLKPNGEPAASSLIETVDPDGAGMMRRPRPFVPA